MNATRPGFKAMSKTNPIKTLKEREKEHLQSILVKTDWDKNQAARLLKISISRLERKIRKHCLKNP